MQEENILTAESSKLFRVIQAKIKIRKYQTALKSAFF